MKCEEIEKLLPDYLSGDISASQRQLVEEHLPHCARCRKALAACNEARQYLTSLKDSPVPPEFTQATMTKVKAATTKSRSQQWLRPALAASAAVVILVLLLVTQPWGVIPQSVMAKAYAATESLQSYRVFSFTTYTYESKTVDITWEIEFAAPDHYHAKVTVDDDVNEVIIIGDKQYAREPRGGKVVATVIERSFPGKEDTLGLLDQLTDLEKLTDESVEGMECLHYRGRIDVERIVEKQKAKLDPEQLGYGQILKDLERLRNAKTDVELWIGKDDYLIRQVKQYWEFLRVEPASRSAEQEIWHTANIMWKYYDLSEPIEIEPPTTASGELLPGWRLIDSPSTGPKSEQPPYPSKTPPS